ncbi:DEKNAAC100874 [Brettanomyces naardenensis]|uniref:DEKNAAC100874 n=1 Tax=Brettanomyces naardenensis TaxID=13370 RepID=A0A448YEN3_BRENA|nr:DEKNAAC100874 [Brettanomyces naardenensis]
MLIAIEGCCHGVLDQIYSRVPKNVELLIICGDFQSIRNKADMECISVPPKYRSMGDFQDYYTGKKKAPVLTIFVGGNHEASNYLEELKYGGFVAPNIYYLGRSGCVWYKGLRIAGWSGIYKSGDFMRLRRDESLPYNRWTVRSVYHYRKDDYMKLRLMKPSNDSVVVSHDWPEGIYRYGSLSYLLKNKPFFKKDIEKGELGSPMNRELLNHLRPQYWFAAHLHTGFNATIDWNRKRIGGHDQDISRKMAKIENKDEITLEISDGEEDGEDAKIDEKTEPVLPFHTSTQFLALDKCLPRRTFLKILEIPINSTHRSVANSSLYYDPEYIAIMKSVDRHRKDLDDLSFRDILNPNQEYQDTVLKDAQQSLAEFGKLSPAEYDELFQVDMNGFVETASPESDSTQLKAYDNPQTISFEGKFQRVSLMM